MCDLADCLDGLSMALALLGECEMATQVHGAVTALRRALGTPSAPVYATMLDQAERACLSALGADEYQRLETLGAAESLDHLVSNFAMNRWSAAAPSRSPGQV
jgi:hypothetical protein